MPPGKDSECGVKSSGTTPLTAFDAIRRLKVVKTGQICHNSSNLAWKPAMLSI